MRLTDNEKAELWGMRYSFGDDAAINHAVGEFKQGITDLLDSSDPIHIYRALAGIERLKATFQRVHNYSHTLAMLAAKAFLEEEFPAVPWQDIEFAEDANRTGFDLDLPEFRIVAELKTMEPCGRSKSGMAPTKFGSNQKKNIEADLRKLSAPEHADFARYMFVTSPLAYRCLIRDYQAAFPGVCFVLLSALPEVSRPLTD
jgi:hypothetical protein